ncbi:CYTH and CHAD domain-containing protein [Oceanisphaera arctica]|uniref:Adenylate cyclase n=1 Tax=Oceanisphaera arctica TaxID=641510 RepID=A0A2P5TP90_9GAMM|nr:inorganic triphosphatase [Oceanisphaera arctica]PPL17458.1 adenylate cyclase [Oceanisphaera arctica]GHA07848.1 inorganic triphosphatase [Oceanisphaera arctica]
MDTEIELKFLVSPDVANRLPTLLQSYQILKQDQQHLANTYFDTADLALRKMDAGLRIRSQNGEMEQTVKLAGSQVGGLHQRPEYNVPLTVHTPDLSLFPARIWPEGVNPAQIQQSLQPLFSTDFLRRRWLLVIDGTEIELALDEGEVQAGDRREPIHELELELVKGDASQLFELAEVLVKEGGLRLGAVSKAKRGYQLAGLSPKPRLQMLEPLVLKPEDTCEQTMVALLHKGLCHWQHHEEGWLAESDSSLDWLAQLREGVSLVHQTLLLFGEQLSHRVNSGWIDDLLWLQQQLSWLDRAQMLTYLTADKGHYLRRLDCRKTLTCELMARQELLPDEAQLQALLYSARYGRLMLGLTHWLYRQDWRAGLSPTQVTQLAAPVASLARQRLDDSWHVLRHSALGEPRLDGERYIQQKGKLRRNLMVGLCFSTLYPEAERIAFRMPWLDILRGIEDLDMLSPLLDLRDELNEQDAAELDEWLARKQRFLLKALEQSRAQALLLKPYWR